MLHDDVRSALNQVVGETATLSWDVAVEPDDDDVVMVSSPLADPLATDESVTVASGAATAVLVDVKKSVRISSSVPASSSTEQAAPETEQRYVRITGRVYCWTIQSVGVGHDQSGGSGSRQDDAIGVARTMRRRQVTLGHCLGAAVADAEAHAARTAYYR